MMMMAGDFFGPYSSSLPDSGFGSRWRRRRRRPTVENPAVHFSTCCVAATAFFVHCLKADRAPSAFPFETMSLGGAEEDAKYTVLLVCCDDGTALVPEHERLPLSLARYLCNQRFQASARHLSEEKSVICCKHRPRIEATLPPWKHRNHVG